MSSAAVSTSMMPNGNDVHFSNLDRNHVARTATMDQQLIALEAVCADLESLCAAQANAKRDDRVAALEAAATDLGIFRPDVEAVINDLKLEVPKITKHWEEADACCLLSSYPQVQI
jgi:hypothetical protein